MAKDNRSGLRLSASLLAMSALLAATNRAAAQDTGSEEPAVTRDELIVTARKRAQSIQDVPLSLQAFDNDSIREKGLRDFQDYSKELTSVAFGTSSPGATTIAFRGALAQPTGFDTISSSVLYLDEIPITRDGQNPDVRLIDIERLEALNGPQPTIYGAGSQSGTLKIVTAKPNTSEFSGWAEVGASTTRDGEPSYDVSGAINIPLVKDELAIRLVGFYEREGGYIDNVLGTTSAYSDNNGTRDNADFVDDDINDYTGYGGRAMLRWQPNDDWTVDAGVIYQVSELDALFDFNPAFGDLDTIKFKDENRDDEWYNVSLTIQGDLGFADLTVASGFHRRSIDYDVDSTAYMTAYRDNILDYLSYNGFMDFPSFPDCYAYTYLCFTNAYNFGPDPTGTISLDQRVRSFVQEVRLTSKDDGESRFNWLLGAFYERTNNDWDYLSNVDDLDIFGGPDVAAYYYYFGYYDAVPTEAWFDQGFQEGILYNGLPGNDFNGYLGDLESIAVFGEVSYDVTDTITISGGGRWYTTDYRVAENSIYVGVSTDDNFDEELNTKDFAPRANITWEPTDDFLTYFTYSEGTRIGGTNGGVSQSRINGLAIGIEPESYSSDRLVNYEVGVKSTWLDGRIVANVSAFMMNWRDFQLQADLPISGPAVVNAGNASIDGVEGQFAFKPTNALEFSTAVTYLDARVDEDLVLPTDSMPVAAFAGDPLPAVPEWKLTAGVNYETELPWSGLTGYARFDVAHTGESVNGTTTSVSLFGAGVTVPQTQPAYQIGDLSVGIKSDADWQVWFSVNNIWDERAITYIWPRFSDNRVFTVRPREFRIGVYKGF
ncbi:MAG: TonB-dependent receptor [Pseudomonadota bacterium]